jgi:NTE family protein
MSFGLVLGGGGIVGVAWETGVLAALAEARVLEPAQAAAMVGTSAGAAMAAQLASGTSVTDLVGAQLRSVPGAGVRPPAANPTGVAEIFATLMAATEMTTELSRDIGRRACELPTRPEEERLAEIAAFLGGAEWPLGVDLRLVAVSCATGERRVWTSGDGVELAKAVASSCAVPGVSPPVTIGGDRFMDGGVWSPSNADVLIDSAFDVVVFIGPIGGFLAGQPQIERELAALNESGARTVSVLAGPPFTDLQANMFDPEFRRRGFELGRTDGMSAARAVRDVLSG